MNHEWRGSSKHAERGSSPAARSAAIQPFQLSMQSRQRLMSQVWDFLKKIKKCHFRAERRNPVNPRLGEAFNI